MHKIRIRALGRGRQGQLQHIGFHDYSADAARAGLWFQLGITSAVHDLLINVAIPGDNTTVSARSNALLDALGHAVRENGLGVHHRYRFAVVMPDRGASDRYELVALYTKVAHGTNWMLLDVAHAWECV